MEIPHDSDDAIRPSQATAPAPGTPSPRYGRPVETCAAPSNYYACELDRIGNAFDGILSTRRIDAMEYARLRDDANAVCLAAADARCFPESYCAIPRDVHFFDNAVRGIFAPQINIYSGESPYAHRFLNEPKRQKQSESLLRVGVTVDARGCRFLAMQIRAMNAGQAATPDAAEAEARLPDAGPVSASADIVGELDKTDRAILIALAQSRMPMQQADLAEGAGYGKRTLQTRLPNLKDKRLIRRAGGDGKAGGYVLTAHGREICKSFAP